MMGTGPFALKPRPASLSYCLL